MAVRASFRLRIYLDDISAVGPGKVALLESIIEHGSIRAAALNLEMSYNRAWLLIKELNQCFIGPVVNANVGGSKGGGAEVTEIGYQLIERYRTIEKEALKVSSKRIKAITNMLKKPI